mmetsp:Transcript_2136/g.4311  ORF Transcript_2136/g.4311 Transcript_2136/m.4311 type:complete len:89 (-) Transcript_2136:220-486(-)
MIRTILDGIFFLSKALEIGRRPVFLLHDTEDTRCALSRWTSNRWVFCLLLILETIGANDVFIILAIRRCLASASNLGFTRKLSPDHLY